MKICSVDGCGKPHLAKGFCCSCYSKDWHKRHPEWGAIKYLRHKGKMRARHDAWIDAHPEFHKEYYHKNREKNIDRVKLYHRNHPDRVNESRRNTYSKNPDVYKTMNKRWRSNNPDKFNDCRRAYFLRKKNAEGFHTTEQWNALRDSTEGWCLGWNRESHFVGVDNLTRDHKVSLKMNGTDFIWNIQPMCKSCNCSKREHIDFREAGEGS